MNQLQFDAIVFNFEQILLGIVGTLEESCNQVIDNVTNVLYI